MRLLPVNESFFDDLDKHTALIVSAADVLETMVQPGERSLAEPAERIKTLEAQGDDIVHRVTVGLRRTFITPLDRDDTYHLISRLDDVLDLVEAVAYRLALYRLHVPNPHLTRLVELVKRSAAVVQDAVANLREKPRHDRALERCAEINKLENDADDTLRAALQQLFAETTDAILIIKWKEVFETLEESTDRCEDVADAIENLLLDA